MFNTNEWFYFTEALDRKICNKIRNVAKGNWEQSAVDTKKGITEEERITSIKQIKGIDINSRISDVAWAADQWIYDTVWPWMKEANKRAGWNYEWDFSETCQFTVYNTGQFYSWHTDGGSRPYIPFDPTDEKQRRKNPDGSWMIVKDDTGKEVKFDKKKDANLVSKPFTKGLPIIFPPLTNLLGQTT